MPVDPVAAATVVVLRDAPAGLQVLLVRRHERSGDFAGASVFPGGVIDPADSDPDLAPPQSAFVASAALAALGEPLAPRDALALHVAACRELFEEARLLLARRLDGSPIDPQTVERAAASRPELQARREELKALLGRECIVLALDALMPFARWITPEIQRRRWDTRFFLATAPAGQTAASDGAETTEVMWLAPDEALSAYRDGAHLLAPPTFRVLEDLRSFARADDAIAAARSGGPPQPILPVPLADAPTLTMVYPGDRDYPGAAGGGLNRIALVDGRWRSRRSAD